MVKKNVVFATDRKYLRHLAVALVSLLEHNSGLDIYIINRDITDADWNKLGKIRGVNNSRLINIKISDKEISNLVTPSYFSKAAYYKLYIPEVVHDSRAFYLDSDIVVNQSIGDLYNTDISKVYLAAIDNMEHYNYQDLEMSSAAKYFNSGVMLINLELWRSCDIKNKVISFINNKPEVIRFVDQDGLNSVINGKWLELHPKYNLHTGLLYKEYAQDSLIKEAINNPVIIHYTGSSKPCQFMNNHPCKDLYWKYLRKTPYKYFIPDDFGIVNILKRITPTSVKNIIKKVIR